MGDTYGALAQPVPVPADGEPVSDPALAVMLAFGQAVLNAKMSAAWAEVAGGVLPVRAVFDNDPERESFNDKSLPALYGYRKPGKPAYDLAEDYRVSEDLIVLIWALPSTPQFRQRLRSPAVNGMGKMLDRSINRGREPAYVKAGDPDPLAATLPAAPTAIKLSVATSAAPASYSGGALDGALGTAALSPPRAITVTLGGDPSSFTPSSSIVVSGENALGLAIARTFTVGAVPATFSTDCDFASVTSVDVDAQAGTAGTISVGAAAFAGLGSVLLDAVGAMQIVAVKAATPRLLVIKGSDAGKPARPLTYPCVEIQFSLVERLYQDPAEYDALGGESELGADLTVTRSDGTTPFEEANF